MFTFGYTSRKAAIIKSIIVLVIGVAGLATRTFFGFILGAILVGVGVRDLLWLYNSRPGKQEEPAGEEEKTAPREDGLKITDLSAAKEVDYKREEGSTKE